MKYVIFHTRLISTHPCKNNIRQHKVPNTLQIVGAGNDFSQIFVNAKSTKNKLPRTPRSDVCEREQDRRKYKVSAMAT